jgi:hypothetical protein
LLRTLSLAVPEAASASYLEPLANAPSLIMLHLHGPADLLRLPLEPLARCTHLRSLGLFTLSLRLGDLSSLLRQLARAGGRLENLELAYVRMFPVTDFVSVANEVEAVSLELSLAAPSLSHLHTLILLDTTLSLDCVAWMSSLRWLRLSLDVLPSASKLHLLLSHLPNLRCVIQRHIQPEWQEHNEATLIQLQHIAQQCTRLVIKEID